MVWRWSCRLVYAQRPYTLYATWPMRGTAHVSYTSWCERGPLAAVDAVNRSHREGAAPAMPILPFLSIELVEMDSFISMPQAMLVAINLG
jgi:hypothetical protein